MSSTFARIVGTARRATSRFIPPRLRIPRPPVTGGGGPVLGDGTVVNTVDKALEPYAEMALAIGSNFNMGAELIPGIYDRSQHKYRDSYLHDSTLALFLSARPGLDRHASTLLPGNPIPRRHLPPGRPLTTPLMETWNRLSSPVATLQRQVQEGPAGSGTTPPVQPAPPVGPPEEVVAYDWVITHTGTAWSKHLIVQNPTAHDVMQSLVIDGEGTYGVRLRVFATGNRFFEKKVTFSVQEKFILAIGDSFAAGQGNPDREGSVSNANPLGGPVCDAATATIAADAKPMMEQEPVWLEARAHRSFRSHHARAALSLQHTFGETWNKTTGAGPSNFEFTKVTFASFARSGATIRGSLLSPQGGDGDFIGAGQLEELRRAARRRPIDALLISIGGNDAGFSGVLTSLVKEDSVYTVTSGVAGRSPAQVKDRLDHLLGLDLPAGQGQKGEIEVDLETLRAAIDNLRRDTPIADVYINGYPEDLFFVTAGGQVRFSACGIFSAAIGFLSISEAEGKMIKAMSRTLNELLERKAAEFSWHFVPLAPDFAGKGYCQGGRNAMWIQAEQSCRTQGDFDGTMHPTDLGHTFAALRYHEQLVQHTM